MDGLSLDELDSLGCQVPRKPVNWVCVLQNPVAPPSNRALAKRRKATKADQAAAKALASVNAPKLAADAAAGADGPDAARHRLVKHRKEPRDPTVVSLPPEQEDGNVEYKLKIRDVHQQRLVQLTTQMKYRMAEGGGECFYYVGVEDQGYPIGLEAVDLRASMETLRSMAATLNASSSLVRYLPGAHGRSCALLRVHGDCKEDVSYVDLRLAVAGSMDAGKSTLVAVLTHGCGGRPSLDSGRGSARMNVFRHKHEMQSGRTSSISTQALGYDTDGSVLNYNYKGVAALTLMEISSLASRLLTFIDLGGHEKYLKTALYGMTCLLPDHALLCVSAAAGGLCRLDREHLAVAMALEVPVALVVTKVDLVDAEQLAQVISDIRQLLTVSLQCADSPSSLQEIAPVVSSEAQAVDCARVLYCLHTNATHLPQPQPTSTPLASVDEPSSAPITSSSTDFEGCTVTTASQKSSHAACSSRTSSSFCVPIFPVSSVTGVGLTTLHAFLRTLQPTAQLTHSRRVQRPISVYSQPVADVHMSGHVSTTTVATEAAEHASAGAALACGTLPSSCAPVQQDSMQLCNVAGNSHHAAGAGPVHFQVDHIFEVAGVGSVLSGTLVTGAVHIGQRLMLGPTASGGFQPVDVTSIQRSHIPVKQLRPGQTATIALQLAWSYMGTEADFCIGSSSNSLPTAATTSTSLPERAARKGKGPKQAGWLCNREDQVSQSLGHTTATWHAVCPNRQAQASAVAETCTLQAEAAGGDSAYTQSALAQPHRTHVGHRIQESHIEKQRLETEKRAQALLQSDLDDFGFGGLSGDEGEAQGHSAPLAAAAGLLAAAPACESEECGLANNLDLNSMFATFGGQQATPLLDQVFQPARPNPLAGPCTGWGVEAPAPSRRSVPDRSARRAAVPGSRVHISAVKPLKQLLLEQLQEQGTLPLHLLPQPAKSAADTTEVHKPTEPEQQPQHHTDRAPHHSGVRSGRARRERAVGAHTSPSALGTSPSSFTPPHHSSWAAAAQSAGHCTSSGRSLDTPWAACQLATSPQSPSFLATSPPNSRKGAVLLDVALQPRTLWTFEAVLVLLGGRWPARGLVSGRWPTVDGEARATTVFGMPSIADVALQKGRLAVGGSSGTTSDTGAEADSSSASVCAQHVIVSASEARIAACAIALGNQAAISASAAGVSTCSSMGMANVDQSSACAQDGSMEALQPVAVSACGVSQRSCKKRAGGGGGYMPVVHCGSIRQPAHVVSMQELPCKQAGGMELASPATSGNLQLPASVLAAAAVLHSTWRPSCRDEIHGSGAGAAGNGSGSAGGGSSDESSDCTGGVVAPGQGDCGCLVQVVFRFAHRPEWLCEGARLIVRDRGDGHLAGAGFVRRVID